jgi:hypothetical protein
MSEVKSSDPLNLNENALPKNITRDGTMKNEIEFKLNNCATNDPCAICGARCDPTCGVEPFAAGTWALVCDECALEICNAKRTDGKYSGSLLASAFDRERYLRREREYAEYLAAEEQATKVKAQKINKALTRIAEIWTSAELDQVTELLRIAYGDVIYGERPEPPF